MENIGFNIFNTVSNNNNNFGKICAKFPTIHQTENKNIPGCYVNFSDQLQFVLSFKTITQSFIITNPTQFK